MRQLPQTTSTLYSLHAYGEQDPLEITIPGDPEQYRVLTILGWSFSRKPSPIGWVECRNVDTNELLFGFQVTSSGASQIDFGQNNPVSPKGIPIKFLLRGNGGMKTLAVQVK